MQSENYSKSNTKEKIIEELIKGQKTNKELEKSLKKSKSTISKHLHDLYEQGLLKNVDGAWKLEPTGKAEKLIDIILTTMTEKKSSFVSKSDIEDVCWKNRKDLTGISLDEFFEMPKKGKLPFFSFKDNEVGLTFGLDYFLRQKKINLCKFCFKPLKPWNLLYYDTEMVRGIRDKFFAASPSFIYKNLEVLGYDIKLRSSCHPKCYIYELLRHFLRVNSYEAKSLKIMGLGIEKFDVDKSFFCDFCGLPLDLGLFAKFLAIKKFKEEIVPSMDDPFGIIKPENETDDPFEQESQDLFEIGHKIRSVTTDEEKQSKIIDGYYELMGNLSIALANTCPLIEQEKVAPENLHTERKKEALDRIFSQGYTYSISINGESYHPNCYKQIKEMQLEEYVGE